MALSSVTVIEVQTGGNDTNGGGFVAGASGTDYSQVAGKRTGPDVTDISVTDAVTNGTSTITSATANFQTSIIGNLIYLAGGTGGLAARWREVTARASTTSITVDATVAASTGVTLNIGGALASPGCAASFAVGGNYVYIKAGTYAILSASTNIPTGCVVAPVGVAWEGYQTTRGDYGTPPLLQASGISSFAVFSGGSSNRNVIRNIHVDGAGLTSSRAFAALGLYYRCGAFNCTGGAYDDALSVYERCFATGCSTVPAFNFGLNGGGHAIDCVAYNNTVTGFSLVTASSCIRCISDSNSGASSDGFLLTERAAHCHECVAYNNGRDGFRITDGGNLLQNCLSENNAGWSYIITGTAAIAIHNQLVHCGGFTNGGSGETSIANTLGNRNYDYVTGTSTFFTDAPNQDFSLNNTIGGGADARGTGYPGTLDTGGTGYLDRGALQHQDGSGGSPGGSPVGASVEPAFGYIG